MFCYHPSTTNNQIASEGRNLFFFHVTCTVTYKYAIQEMRCQSRLLTFVTHITLVHSFNYIRDIATRVMDDDF